MITGLHTTPEQIMDAAAEDPSVELRQGQQAHPSAALQRVGLAKRRQQGCEGTGQSEGSSRHEPRSGCVRVPQQEWLWLGGSAALASASASASACCFCHFLCPCLCGCLRLCLCVCLVLDPVLCYASHRVLPTPLPPPSPSLCKTAAMSNRPSWNMTQ